ncbi:MAG: hypothetical protein ACERIH_11475 [Labilibaculum antarcticum]
MKNKVEFLFVCIFLICTGANAQDKSGDSHTVSITIPEVAILDIESAGSKDIALSFTAPKEAGLGVTGSSNSSLWLNYSSIKSASNTTRTVSASVNNTIAGADIIISAASSSGGGAGTIGEPSGDVTLTTSEQVIVNNIGSCYTGSGVNNGHNLTYTLKVNGSYEELEASSQTPLTVTYTFSN